MRGFKILFVKFLTEKILCDNTIYFLAGVVNFCLKQAIFEKNNFFMLVKLLNEFIDNTHIIIIIIKIISIIQDYSTNVQM